MSKPANPTPATVPAGGAPAPKAPAAPSGSSTPPKEIGGREGPDPTRYGDWEKNGRCVDF